MTSSQPHVLVTGGSGFIAGHCILQLLEQGYRVRTTVRTLGREPEVRKQLGDAGTVNAATVNGGTVNAGTVNARTANGGALSFVAADLTSDTGWAGAVAGCDFVLHTASPVHVGHVKNEDDVVVPAREGTLRVLRAARDAGVKRVVLTSAFHAVAYGYPRTDHRFTEEDWSVLDGPGVTAYTRSKTLSERAAWDFIDAEGGSTELATILPVAVMGPVMAKAVSGSNHLVRRILDGAMPGYPDLWIPIVDVRDVASAHLLAMTTPEAAGQRFLTAGGPAIPMKQIGAVLRAGLGAAARHVPTRSLPDAVVRMASLFDKELRTVVPDLGFARRTTSAKARSVLGWRPRHSPEAAILATAESLIRKELVKA
ncbi:SDR family oxidoreductase [Streptomyces bambusae]|uniref:NAD-dependent epimerase/dehydratase family protein n=1 Tax=Streptomyces bambusae TaxID=1550616 RepID=A0ABS6ZDE9_9ACTN|nr:aldehyde reductase [Streptomyces bambusae]MBW5485788.1 NAD-dependent epimerase/dehydratase family protein [Streptomyces bambusae]